MTDSFTNEPSRLIESNSGLPDHLGLRRDLEAARAARIEYSVDAGLARFEASLAAGVSTLPSGGTLAGFSVLRWFFGASALLGIGVIAWLLVQPQFRSEDGKVAEIDSTVGVGDPSSVASIDEASSPDVDARESVAEPQQPDGNGERGASERSDGGEPIGQLAAVPRPTSDSVGLRPTPESAGLRPTPESAPEPVVLRPTPKSSSLDEAQLIDAARKALASDPARTLELTEQVAERFPTGTMIQERRGYAILALFALDRRAEAEAQAGEYLERWPKGPLSRRIETALLP